MELSLWVLMQAKLCLLYNPVGSYCTGSTGKDTEEINKNVVELRFDGENAVKSIDTIIEDLTTIKENLIKEK